MVSERAAFTFAVVAEARADQQIGSELAERVMVDEVDWIDEGGKANAKKVLKRLMRPESEREESCWQQADLSVLKERGKGSRLTAFLEEVSNQLVPMLAGGKAP